LRAGLDTSEKDKNILHLPGTKPRFLARPTHNVVNIQTAPISEVDVNERFIKKLKQTEVREWFCRSAQNFVFQFAIQTYKD